MKEYTPEEQAFDNGSINAEEYYLYRDLSEIKDLPADELVQLNIIEEYIENRGSINTVSYGGDDNPYLTQLSQIWDLVQNGRMTSEKAKVILDNIGREN